MTLLWCSSKFAQWSEYLPRPSASGNIPTLGAMFIDIPRGRVEYL